MIRAKDSDSVSYSVYLCMLNFFKNYLIQHCGVQPGEKILLAVSGGKDSMAMVHLFNALNINDFGIAHCNFALRGKESDEDEMFVKNYATSIGKPFHNIVFDTKEFAAAHHLSIQDAARKLRYDWFHTLCKLHGYQCIATAHHLNDAVETFLMNAARGSGIRGLHGIPVRNGIVIRPLLFAERPMIEQYIIEHQIPFREDASNATTDYTRNSLRHRVIPVLQEIMPDFIPAIGKTMRLVQESEVLYDYALQLIRDQIVSSDNNEMRILRHGLFDFPAPHTVLFEILKDYGFNPHQVADILNSHTGIGGIFYSPAYQLLIDREHLIVQKKAKPIAASTMQIQKGETNVMLPDLSLDISYHDTYIRFTTEAGSADLVADKLIFPLNLRHWQAGDKFQPAGMGGQHKKLQDLLTNLKLSRFEKEKIYVLLSGTDICWVVGIRADARYIMANG